MGFFLTTLSFQGLAQNSPSKGASKATSKGPPEGTSGVPPEGTSGVIDELDFERQKLDRDESKVGFNTFGFEGGVGLAKITSQTTDSPLDFNFAFVSKFGMTNRIGFGLESMPAFRNILGEYNRIYDFYLEAQHLFGFVEAPFGVEGRVRLGSRSHFHSSSLSGGLGFNGVYALASHLSLLSGVGVSFASETVGGTAFNFTVGLRFEKPPLNGASPLTRR